jgi:hypothetical protein
MPVTGQDAVPYSAFFQRKAHVGASIVYCKHTSVVMKNSDCMTISRNDDATAGFEFIYSPDPHLF